MTFQWRVSLFVVLALIAALLAQFVLGFFLFERALTRDLANDLTRFASWFEQSLVISEQGASLPPESLGTAREYSDYASGRGRLLNPAGRPVLLIGGRFPEGMSGWLLERRQLDSGYTLEVAMSRRSHNVALRDYLQVSLVGLPTLVLLFGALSLWLSWQLLSPLRTLQKTVSSVASSADLSARVQVGIANDELSKLACSYNDMMARLERFFERERTFTRYASHELRNPLTALRVQVEAGLNGDLPTSKVLVTLRRELDRLSGLLDSLLILARDQLPPTNSFNLVNTLQESVDRARTLAADKPLMIDYLGPNQLPFRGDQLLLSRLVDNLLENAIKYSPAGQICVQLELREKGVRLRVSDQGEGVPEAYLENLSTPFYRVKKTADGGTGLGLAAVRHIAEAHGASVRFENLTPVGFAVTLDFPTGGLQ